MNKLNRESMILRAKHKASSIKSGVVAAVATAAALPGFAFAQQTATFDPASVLAGIAAMLAAGILIYTAWVAAKWALKAFGIVK
ncbi:TPA: hypothetical protein ACKQBZ_000240 [Stenotrophomonas maltophilia]|uniref:Phage coat protein n=1 Tax=Stenotrophomonas maltophilia TaxID=40324 RepID=A0AAJ2MV83_STEMA|nr:hypothetical protein [Stenotrophomonas maltophilia]MDT3468372.1 hypothetical protein [Stenotrophomonas maltophilia]